MYLRLGLRGAYLGGGIGRMSILCDQGEDICCWGYL